jgi:hypothetical protein
MFPPKFWIAINIDAELFLMQYVRLTLDTAQH